MTLNGNTEARCGRQKRLVVNEHEKNSQRR